MTPPRGTRSQAIALAAGAVILFAALAEIGLRVFSPVVNPYDEIERLRPQINQYIRFEYPRNYSAVTEAEPGLPGLSGKHHFTTDNMGFRGDPLIDPKPANEFRIFMVGGSTTECFYLDDNDDMSRVMQRKLAGVAPPGTSVKVYNVGMSGAASDDHVAMISQRLVHLQPDLVVVFCGINDLTRSIYNYDYRHYIEYRPAYHKPWYKRLLMKFQIVRRLFLLKERINPDRQRLQEQRTLVTNYAGLIGLERSAPVSDAVPRTDETSYATNLRSMAGIARANHFEMVFMTQQTTWNSAVDSTAHAHHWMRYRAGAPGPDGLPTPTGFTFREDQMDAAMGRLNDSMRSVCREESVPLYDLARELPRSLEYFYDDCHFNVKGARITGLNLSRFLIGQGLVPASTTSD
ncbi:MAG TPA: SGNH/GDSL hydrolase family protein [Candidatus Krumholzibacteria bacterium]|nr:SGNH/GDSL hydrolase family protein [Candidatus Krumholzibacteria bacterium]